jgi:hypothetical protein
MSVVFEADITEPNFIKLAEGNKTAYLADANRQFTAQALKYGIDESQIPVDPDMPYHPKRIGVVNTLILMCSDLMGTSFREVREGFSIDVYKVKRDEYLTELEALLKGLTPELCGYTDDTDDSTNNTSFHFERE